MRDLVPRRQVVARLPRLPRLQLLSDTADAGVRFCSVRVTFNPYKFGDLDRLEASSLLSTLLSLATRRTNDVFNGVEKNSPNPLPSETAVATSDFPWLVPPS